MSTVFITPVHKEDFDDFFTLICALATYEKLSPPDACARKRLYDDCFERTPPRFEALIAREQQSHSACAYCIYFETYSSFLAKPTLFIEDIFVHSHYRKQGIGRALLQHVAQIALERGCGRMEWMVLDWNEPAHHFYERCGAERLLQWQLYRLSEHRIVELAYSAQE